MPASIKSDSTGRTELACFVTDPSSSPADWFRGFVGTGQFDVAPFYAADSAGVSKLAWTRPDPAGTMGERILQLATIGTSCDGTMPFEITMGRHPRFSPNGERVVFITIKRDRDRWCRRL